MSYVDMDHAGWVEKNNVASNSLFAKRKSYRPAPEKLSPFQAIVMDILGMVGGGIYNTPIDWERVVWDFGVTGVSVILRWGSLATFDNGNLTNLVFLCHEARVRCEISAHVRDRLRLSFWPRKDAGDFSGRHPSLDEAVTAFRRYLPADHRIIYKPPTT